MGYEALEQKAKEMGLPVARLICASNRNNVLTDFFKKDGEYNRNRDFFTTTVADIPAEMVRREEEAAEEHKGLFGRLFGLLLLPERLSARTLLPSLRVSRRASPLSRRPTVRMLFCLPPRSSARAVLMHTSCLFFPSPLCG